MATKLFTMTLAEDEVKLYRIALRSAGYDPDLYMENRRIEAPVEHYAEMAHALTGQVLSDMLRDEGEVYEKLGVEESVPELQEKITHILGKALKEVNQTGASERADRAMEDIGGFLDLNETIRMYELLNEKSADTYGALSASMTMLQRTMARFELECNWDEAELDEFYRTINEEAEPYQIGDLFDS